MQELIARLKLLKTPGIGKVTFFHLLETFGNASETLKHLSNYSLFKKKNYILPSDSYIIEFLNKCKKQHTQLIFFDQEEYPKELLKTLDYPPLLYCKGNVKLLNKPSIAVIGSRSASLQARVFTKKIINDLSDFAIISGFAKGIDTTAHEASLLSGTIAVFGCGINHIYPEDNVELYDKILKNQGLLISEIGLDEPPKQNFFSYRNRLISGISKGVLVIEAGFKSGSLITTDYALEQGKPIFAVPSHPLDPKSIGTNYLIKNGAILTSNAQDIINEFNIYKDESKDKPILKTMKEDNVEEVKEYILSNTPYNQILIKDLINNSPYHIKEINTAIAELELSGEIFVEYCYIQRTKN